MKRQKIDDGGWFDLEKAKRWDEDTHWNGNNHISNATGSQWEHERLYKTAKGVFVLNHWSQWQGSGQSWAIVSASEAAEWLIQNGEDPSEAGTEVEKAAIAQEV